MRVFLALALVVGSAIAAPANDLQLVIEPKPGVGAVEEPAVLHTPHEYGPIETNLTIYEYLSQQDECVYPFCRLVHGRVSSFGRLYNCSGSLNLSS